MYSSSDFEKLWFLYKIEGEPQGISINSFCLIQGVPYRDFNTWFVKTRKKIVPVQIEGVLVLIPLWKNPPLEFVLSRLLHRLLPG